MQYRIGDRDPVTGLYDVIWPDGSTTRNGIKIFNSAHEFGDVVLAIQRSDGMMILDGVKATVTQITTTSFGLGGFGEKFVGYLNGQVFNNEEEVILPTVSIEFAPGSPTELEPGAGDFVVRIKIDRPQRKDLRVKLELSGTAGSGDYTYTGLDNDLFAVIPAEELYFDVVVTPIQNSLGTNEDIIIALVVSSDYIIGTPDIATANILAVVVPINYRISRTVGIFTNGSLGVVDNFVYLGNKLEDDQKLIGCVFSSVDFNGDPVAVQNQPLLINYSLLGSAIGGVNYQLPAGATVLAFATIGSIAIPVGQSQAILYLTPIITSSPSAVSVGLGSGNYASQGTSPSAAIYPLTKIRVRAGNDLNNIALYPDSADRIQNGIGTQFNGYQQLFEFTVLGGVEDTTINFVIGGDATLATNYEIITQPNNITSAGGSITIDPSTDTFILEFRSIAIPRIIGASKAIDLQLVQDVWQLDVENRAIAKIQSRSKATYSTLSTGSNTPNCSAPAQYFSVLPQTPTERIQYLYSLSPSGTPVARNFTSTGLLGAVPVPMQTFIGVSNVIEPSPPGETVAQRRARLLGISGAVWYEIVLAPTYILACNYQETI